MSDIKLIDEKFMENLQEMCEEEIMLAASKKKEILKLVNKPSNNLYLKK